MRFSCACVAVALLFSSCAYMQTNKNVEESYVEYKGYELEKPLCLTQRAGQWYLVAEAQTLQKKYPAVYDSIFFTGKNDPHFEVKAKQNERWMHPISAGTATVLQRHDGYADWATLCDELKQTPGAWVPVPAGQGRTLVTAMVDDKTSDNRLVVDEQSKTPTEIPISGKLLAGLDKYCIDYPGTLLYNAAIPVMAPFMFFRDFLSAED